MKNSIRCTLNKEQKRLLRKKGGKISDFYKNYPTIINQSKKDFLKKM